ncbi:hypothetical protein SAMN05444397_108109 [Flavobacterium aquidurense]|uniref:DKNYY family protein n=1 Tax=Flavobacterium frigidimaris TaxID=262320 RepID=A0ABX4BQK2_FLAFR|nr:hypothetical protein [Flavobacterium frigidimaris]OXA78862.1 hypothetical protein B0A65_11765 [Flavobacterium frigidimaris]SDZ52167.1 hypothetical protein SAMN05444397_108109 [Flavobacterium aquidurense]
MTNKQRSKYKKWGIIVICSLVLISAIGFFTFKEKTKSEEAETTYESDKEWSSGWVSIEDCNYWGARTFTISEYDDIPLNFKRGIVKIFKDNKYYNIDGDDSQYFFTKIKDRAKKVIAYGNFTNNKSAQNIELAFLLEKQDFESSIIYIISERGDVLFKKEYHSELPTITSFKKKALIYLEEMKLTPSPADGILLKFKSYKRVIIYNKDSKKFEDYYQYDNEDLNRKDEFEEDGESEEPVEKSTDSIQ